ncbi:CGNR zinc finger domain-containing protein [Actinomycetospora lutea]|uniref:CGNR zinc finger domain-containing protein n=1 Tax=Actinomycetospora lutea TaxID=663604 RepID=UPI002366090E|nr:CGNR zinc finger domain-containing protein [Actinomycetospora lutea]MDD7942516.1 CGNR zinc finger domain-containing protein [Actinomycetospora lutea]
MDLSADAGALPWLLADAGARLLTGTMTDRLRRCANHDACVLVFLDTSRNRARRWCSMEMCGNRSKVAAHESRARQRRAQGARATE